MYINAALLVSSRRGENMSDFFGALSGARFPEVVMNSGPLPPEGGLPAPLHDSADARINYGSTLLGDLSPYAYGEPGYQSSQVSYVNHPHRIQKIFPPLLLPSAALNTQHTIHISHPVDDSDIAFVMRLDRGSTFCTMLGNRSLNRHKMGTAIDPYINLCTLNYILAGLQLFYTAGHNSKWAELLHDLDKTRFPNENHRLTLGDLHYIVRELITPFGIVRGSEKQGGQNEVGFSAATWPVSFAGTLVIDGKERNVVNFWHFHDISAGDDLVFRLKPMPVPFQEGYTLNHYYKNVSKQDITRGITGGLAQLGVTHVWQLVPDIFDLNAHPDTMTPGMVLRARMTIERPYHWQEHGYWHIGRSQVMFRKYGEKEYYNNDMVNSLKLNHLDMTFEPCFLSAPGGSFMGSNIAHVVADHIRGDAVSAFTGWQPHLGLEFRDGAQGDPVFGHGDGLRSLQDAMDVFAMPPPQPQQPHMSFVHPDDEFIEDGDDRVGAPSKRARAGESFLSRFLERDSAVAQQPPVHDLHGGGGQQPPVQGSGGVNDEYAVPEEPPPLVISGAMRDEPAPPAAARRRRKPVPTTAGEDMVGE